MRKTSYTPCSVQCIFPLYEEDIFYTPSTHFHLSPMNQLVQESPEIEPLLHELVILFLCHHKLCFRSFWTARFCSGLLEVIFVRGAFRLDEWCKAELDESGEDVAQVFGQKQLAKRLARLRQRQEGGSHMDQTAVLLEFTKKGKILRRRDITHSMHIRTSWKTRQL